MQGFGGRSDLPRGRSFGWRAPSFWIMLVVCWVTYSAFTQKWPTVDDPLFLDYAARLTWNPTLCEVADAPFQGRVVEDYIVFESTHPPFVPYWIKTIGACFGEGLGTLHWGFFVFLVLAAWGLGGLIARYTAFPPVLALGLVLGPLFLPFATGFMTDVPLFALWVGALWFWENYMHATSKRHLYLALAFLMAMAAVATAYQGLGLLVVLLWRGKSYGKMSQAFLLVAIVSIIFLVWLLLVWKHYGIFPYFDPPRSDLTIAGEMEKGIHWTNIWQKVQAMVIYWGAALGPFLAIWLLKVGSRQLIFPLLSVTGWGLVWVWGSPLQDSEMWQWGWVLASAGLIAGLVFFKALDQLRGWQNDGVTPSLLIWAIGFFVFQAFIAALASPRYLLLGFAALFLLILRTLPVRAWVQWALYLGLVVQIGMGFWVARAEFDYADAQRLSSLNLAEYAGDADITVAGEFGLHYSTDQLGWSYYLEGHEDEVSYLLVPSEIDHVAPDSNLIAEAEIVQKLVLPGKTGIRVMNREAEAGLYHSGHGLLPFSFSNARLEEFTLYRCFRQVLPQWQGDGNDARFVAEVAGPILPQSPVSTAFQCDWDGLTRIKLNLATYARRNDSTLQVSLIELEEDGSEREVLRRSIPSKELEDNQWLTLDFDPITSKDRRFKLILASPDATPGNAITIWTNSAADGVYNHGDTRRQGRLKALVFCLPKTFN